MEKHAAISRILKLRGARRCTSLAASAVALLLVTSPPAFAQQPAAPPGIAEPSEEVSGPETPRGAMLGYLVAARAGDYERAAEHLDLRRLPKAQQRERGVVLARQLKIVLDQTLWVEPSLLSTAESGHPDDGLPRNLDRIGTIQTAKGGVEILLQRVPASEGGHVWKISGATVAQIPALWEQFGYGALGDLLPAPLFEIRILEIALWQWMGLLLVAGLAFAISWLVTVTVAHLLRPIVLRFRTTADDSLLEATIAPARFGIAILLFSIGVLALALAVPVRQFFVGLEKAAAIAAVAWLLLRVVDAFAVVTSQRLAQRGRTGAISMVPVGRKAAKVVLLVLAALAVLQNVGINVTGVLAGLGIGGLAVALAAQKTVENLFGGVSVIVDQPVRVGDFCRWSDKIGTVEEIGLRSTRIRTLDRTVVSVPNADFATLQLENFSRRDRIWLHTTLGLRYETTPDQLRHVLIEIRKMLYAHPRVHREPARIRFVSFGAYSLDLEIFAYVLTTDYDEFLAVREDIYLRIMDIVAASGTGFAFPSQTTYLASDGGLDEPRRRSAESQVHEWRARGEMYLPDFPPETIAALGATLQYPPAGAAVTKGA